MSSEGEKHHLVPYRVYVAVWGALVVLTLITVGVSYAELGHLTIFTAILIATVKCSLVLLYFMHLRYDKPILGVMFIATLATYAIFIILTFADYHYR